MSEKLQNAENQFYREIANSIRGTREKMGMSQQNWADVLGVSLEQYQRYENAQDKISMFQMYQIINATQPELITYQNWPKI